jgi:3-keto-disaccharide hydrolase
MTKKFRLSLAAPVAAVLVSVPLLAGQNGQTLNKLTDDEKRDGWALLFDGKSLDGWRGYKETDASKTRWRVENGLLTLSPDDGKDTRGARDIISRDTYDRFELAFEWQISVAGNSGVKYYVLEDLPSAIGHEYQIIDDERHPDAKVGPKRQTAAL